MAGLLPSTSATSSKLAPIPSSSVARVWRLFRLREGSHQAVHLLRSGVDINTIRAWLGHVSLDTTHVYAEVDMEMKATALASLDIKGLPQTRLRPILPGQICDNLKT